MDPTAALRTITTVTVPLDARANRADQLIQHLHAVPDATVTADLSAIRAALEDLRQRVEDSVAGVPDPADPADVAMVALALAFVVTRPVATPARVARANEKRKRARDLRAAGLTFAEIGHQMGLSAERARCLASETPETPTPPLPIPSGAPEALPELSLRVLRALTSAGVGDAGVLRRATDAQLLAIPGLGKRGLQEIRESLAKYPL